MWRVRATVVDKPGFLAVLAASLALRSVNILSVAVHVTGAGAVDDFLVDAPDDVTREQLLAAVERGRGRDSWVARAEAHSLVDAPTRALDLATYLVQNSGGRGGGSAVAHALAELLDAQLARLLVPARGVTLQAEAADRVVGVANLLGEGVQAELALLVEDG
jgi:hypothetical protein